MRRSLKYYMCKYLGHDTYNQGRIVTIDDIGMFVAKIIQYTIASIFILFVSAAAIVLIFSTTMQEFIAFIVIVVVLVLFAFILTEILKFYDNVKDKVLYRCKK